MTTIFNINNMILDINDVMLGNLVYVEPIIFYKDTIPVTREFKITKNLRIIDRFHFCASRQRLAAVKINNTYLKLLQFTFLKNNIYEYNIKNKATIIIHKEGNNYILSIFTRSNKYKNIIIKCNYVHILQNIVKTCTGESLHVDRDAYDNLMHRCIH